MGQQTVRDAVRQLESTIPRTIWKENILTVGGNVTVRVGASSIPFCDRVNLTQAYLYVCAGTESQLGIASDIQRRLQGRKPTGNDATETGTTQRWVEGCRTGPGIDDIRGLPCPTSTYKEACLVANRTRKTTFDVTALDIVVIQLAVSKTDLIIRRPRNLVFTVIQGNRLRTPLTIVPLELVLVVCTVINVCSPVLLAWWCVTEVTPPTVGPATIFCNNADRT